MDHSFETRHTSPPVLPPSATSRPARHNRAQELRSQLLNHHKRETFLKINAGSHDIRSPFTYMKGYVGLIEMDLATIGRSLRAVDPEFDYENFSTLLLLASASVTPEGNLKFSQDEISGFKDATSKTALVNLAKFYHVPKTMEHQLNSATSTRADEQINLIAQYRQLLFQHVLEQKVAKLDDAELMSFVQNRHPKEPARIREYFTKVFHLLKRDLTHLSTETAFQVKSNVPLNDTAVSHLNDMVTAAEEMPNLLDRSMQFLNIDEIDFKKNRVPTSMTAIIDEVIKLHKNRLNNRGITCDVVRGNNTNDELMLHPEAWRVLDNIFSNALNYTKSHIQIVVENLEGQLFVAVIDNGRGLGNEKKKRYFELGEQGVDAIESTGIGLWVANHIVMEHGGFMGVDGEDYRGAAFYYVLPKSPNQTVPGYLREAADSRARDLRTDVLKSLEEPIPVKVPESVDV